MRNDEEVVPVAAGSGRLRLQLLQRRLGADPRPEGQQRPGRCGTAALRCRRRTSRATRSPTAGVVKLDTRRQAVQDQYPLQVVKNPDGSIGTKIVGFVPNVDQTFGGLFKPSSPAPGRAQPQCVKKSLPWQGKIREVKNGVITNTIIK